MSLALGVRFKIFQKEATSIDRFLRGVVYVIDPALASRLALTSPSLLAAATIGSEIFDGSKKRSVEFSVRAFDEVRECEVRERPWPHCWGDAIAAMGSASGEAILLTWNLDAPSHVLLIPAQEDAGPRYHRDYLVEALESLCEVEASKHVLLPPEWVNEPQPRTDDDE